MTGPPWNSSCPIHFIGGYEGGKLIACKMVEIQLLNSVRGSGSSINEDKKSLKEELGGCRPLKVQGDWKTNMACIRLLDLPLMLGKEMKLFLCTLCFKKSLQIKFYFYVGSSCNTAHNFTGSFVILKTGEEETPSDNAAELACVIFLAE